MWVFRLGNEIRKRWEEEDGKITEKYAEMEAKYKSWGEAMTRRGGKVRKKQNGGRGRSSGLERSRRVDRWRRKRRGKGKKNN